MPRWALFNESLPFIKCLHRLKTPEANVTHVLWPHNPNLVEFCFALIFILMMQWGRKTEHVVQACSYLQNGWVHFHLIVMHSFIRFLSWVHRPYVRGVPGSILSAMHRGKYSSIPEKYNIQTGLKLHTDLFRDTFWLYITQAPNSLCTYKHDFFLWMLQCQWSKPWEYRKIGKKSTKMHDITTSKLSTIKYVEIIYCISLIK